MPDAINTFNKFLVGSRGDRILIGAITPEVSADDALLLAAYLVSMAEFKAAHTFKEVLNAVQDT